MQFLWPCRDHPTILVQGQLTPLKIYHPYLSSLTCPAMQQTFTEHCCVGATDGGPRAVGTIIRQTISLTHVSWSEVPSGKWLAFGALSSCLQGWV